MARLAARAVARCSQAAAQAGPAISFSDDLRLLATERLSARPFERGDWPVLQALLSDPRSARALTRTGRPEPDEAKARGAAERFAEAWLSAGLGPHHFTLDAAAGAAPVGYAGLRPTRPGDAAGWELIFALLPAFWGRGLATEAAGAALAGFAPTPADAIWAWRGAENAAAASVLEKLGFRPSHEALRAGRAHVVHRLRVRP